MIHWHTIVFPMIKNSSCCVCKMFRALKVIIWLIYKSRNIYQERNVCITNFDVLFIRVPAQPVHDELEYIKMRYKSPARSSFRDNKMYATLTTQSTAYSTMSRGVDAPNYSDDSADRILHRQQGDVGSPHIHQQQHGSHPHLGQSGVLQVPWQINAPGMQKQTDLPAGMTELPPEGQTEIRVTPADQHGAYPSYYQQLHREGGQVPPEINHPEQGHRGGGPYGFDPQEQPHYRYNITGQTQGVTVI